MGSLGIGCVMSNRCLEMWSRARLSVCSGTRDSESFLLNTREAGCRNTFQEHLSCGDLSFDSPSLHPFPLSLPLFFISPFPFPHSSLKRFFFCYELLKTAHESIVFYYGIVTDTCHSALIHTPQQSPPSLSVSLLLVSFPK